MILEEGDIVEFTNFVPNEQLVGHLAIVEGIHKEDDTIDIRYLGVRDVEHHLSTHCMKYWVRKIG